MTKYPMIKARSMLSFSASVEAVLRASSAGYLLTLPPREPGPTSPNVAPTRGIEAGVRGFLVMELLKGQTLREELQRRGRFDSSATIRILRDVCSAVETAHRRQLLHRDLKPENIFLVHS